MKKKIMSFFILRIAQAQINPIVGDLQGNLHLIYFFLEQARQRKVHLVTFPELAISGCPPEDLLLRPNFLIDCSCILKKIAVQCQNIIAIVGCPLVQNNIVYNCAVVLGQGRILGIYRKIELPNYGVFDEVRYFTSGSTGLLLNLAGIHLMLTICEDIWIKNGLVEHLVHKSGVKVVINISGSPFHAGKLHLRTNILINFACRTKTYIFYNNLLGGQDELIFDGGSLIITPQGTIVTHARRLEQDLLITDLKFQTQIINSGLSVHNTQHYLNLVHSTYTGQTIPAYAPKLSQTKEIYQTLVIGIYDYVKKNGFKKVLLGLSGGVDSSLVAAIAIQALGPDNVIGISMPSQFTSQKTRIDVEHLAAKLDIKLVVLPITNILQIYHNEITKFFGYGPYGIERENLQARIRANLLMGLSNRFGWLLLTTGNKSEIAVGYCTLYGDMAGGFAVLKDVPKTLVYKLSDLINQEIDYELIPVSIINRLPTAELRLNQKDKDFLPPYNILDAILKAYIEQDLSLQEIVSLGFDFQLVQMILQLVDQNEYKRRQGPPGIKITPKAFGRDRRVPITNHYSLKV